MSQGQNALERSRALWNRRGLDLRNLEILAQLLDRGEIESWRELFAIAKHDSTLRSNLRRVVETVPLPMPHFWLAALASLGEPVAWDAALPIYGDDGAV